MTKSHLAESTTALAQASKQHKCLKESKRVCVLAMGPTACLTRSKARRYSTLLESLGKGETDMSCFPVGPAASGSHLTRCSARRFSSSIADCLLSIENPTVIVSPCYRLQLLHEWLERNTTVQMLDNGASWPL